MIKSIGRGDVERICSGQSVVDLSTAVKECVENALDAKATRVDITLQNYGQNGFTVQDNGCGVDEQNYQNLTLKHYTSKISQFEDLESVASFGFRGEALSSICQLAGRFSVCTRTKDDTTGKMLEYDQHGILTSQKAMARPIGTSVIVEDLFKPLPVRLKDFHKNIKRHYSKLLKVLQAYALISSNVKISCSNVTGAKGQMQTVINTQLKSSVRDNIANIFGSQFLKTLTPLALDINTGDENDDNASNRNFQVSGFVSKAGAGVGRTDNDRQFLYINGRPVDIPKVTRALNEVWRQYEMKHKPACILNFTLPNGSFDINVTPDKREVFIKQEHKLLEHLKEGINKIYEPTRNTFQVQSVLSFSQAEAQKKGIQSDEDENEGGKITEDNEDSFENSLHHQKSGSTYTIKTPVSKKKTSSFLNTSDKSRISPGIGSLLNSSIKSIGRLTSKTDSNDSCSLEEDIVENSSLGRRNNAPNFDKVSSQKLTPNASFIAKKSNDMTENGVEKNDVGELNLAFSKDGPDCAISQISGNTMVIDNKRNGISILAKGHVKKKKRIIEDSPLYSSSSTIDVSLEDILMQRNKSLEAASKKAERLLKRQRESSSAIPSAISIHHPDSIQDGNKEDDCIAEEFERVLKKENFKEMQVIGQFNLGFIIASLEEDVFIIDQHASDEKFNYETLMRTTVFHQQPLVTGLPVQLTAAEELAIQENLPIFQANGFQFRIDDTQPPTQKVRVTALPFSKHTQFGLEDIRELASLVMSDSPNKMVRLPKAMAMFASRACRSSVMIGTALHKEDMVKIVCRLADLKQPWNCPHGRPTMRHLFDISLI